MLDLNTAVRYGEETLQPSTPIESDDLMTVQAGNSLDNMGKNSPVGITTMVSSDEKSIGPGANPARKGSLMPTPVEESTTQNCKPQIQKMPAMDRNLESLTSEEIAKTQSPSQRW